MDTKELLDLYSELKSTNDSIDELWHKLEFNLTTDTDEFNDTLDDYYNLWEVRDSIQDKINVHILNSDNPPIKPKHIEFKGNDMSGNPIKTEIGLSTTIINDIAVTVYKYYFMDINVNEFTGNCESFKSKYYTCDMSTINAETFKSEYNRKLNGE